MPASSGFSSAPIARYASRRRACGNPMMEPCMTASQIEKAKRFSALHERPGAFMIPNPWDVGTARLLAMMGFEALATTSAGFAFSLGRPDGGLTRQQHLDHARAIVGASDLPVAADLENCFGDDPATVAET